jgi:ABC-type nitrate/sulfonate/bicarbonate transport system ATPase subunit
VITDIPNSAAIVYPIAMMKDTRMREEVLQLWRRIRVPILLIAHDEAGTAAFDRQVIVFENGRAVS